MLRNRNRSGDFAQEYPYNQAPAQPSLPVSRLEPDQERLVDLSETVGQLGAQNDMLNEDNRRLEQTNKQLEEDNKRLRDRNLELERKDAGDYAGANASAQTLKLFEAALHAKKGAK